MRTSIISDESMTESGTVFDVLSSINDLWFCFRSIMILLPKTIITPRKECTDNSDFRDSTILVMLKQELNRVELS